MKNIHLLPTDRPSSLYYKDDNYKLANSTMAIDWYISSASYKPTNIYITSDEEIKEGDWHLSFLRDKFEVINYLPNGGYRKECLGKEVCKIILTTDQDLIKDGVQAIDDEFLEWFVQNPSCEFVEVIYEPKNFLDTKQGWEYEMIIPKKNFYCGDKFDYDEQCLKQCDTCVDKKGVDYGYLPKEEPKQVLTEEDIFNQKDIDAVTDYISKEQQKQALIDMMKSDEELGLYGEVYSKQGIALTSDYIQNIEKEIKLEELFNDDKRENIKIFIDEIKNPSEPNQALKDAFEKYSEYLEDFENKNTYEHGFKDGAKCQQQISYSEEEVIAFGEFIFKHSLLTHTRGVKSLFEQFKKK
jgi:hypothetical protein